jgi:hypothetical protein
MKTIKAIEINAKEWFDKLNGNSYFAGNIYVEFENGRIDEILMPFQYGYGSYYEHEAKCLLTQFNYISTDYSQNLRTYCESNKIKFVRNFRDKCLKRDLKAFDVQYNNRINQVRKQLINA